MQIKCKIVVKVKCLKRVFFWGSLYSKKGHGMFWGAFKEKKEKTYWWDKTCTVIQYMFCPKKISCRFRTYKTSFQICILYNSWYLTTFYFVHFRFDRTKTYNFLDETKSMCKYLNYSTIFIYFNDKQHMGIVFLIILFPELYSVPVRLLTFLLV